MCCLLQVVTSTLEVDEGGDSVLGPQHLLLSDLDSGDEALQVQLRAGPRHGALRMGPRPLQTGSSFSLEQLRGLELRWVWPRPLRCVAWC